ncbi:MULTISPECIES: ABC transporter substrate-binding protein [unclassified Beijerinckia]|uniref:ABC transporter substrate-binding protein n=1 Tax=unclassified Beijerinckia TaxID=2638183 RepID=UPI00089C48B6|nr:MULTISPECIES: ABC transporter substrate-binding protein [unclassified Beijerinckia]MDH7798983.1 ABC-type nitrate/sulfonate/bicarbonate transport system substrate-binding protein [Beijerinckia sp. GAS462]SED85239.1 ABC-type nitrate/sulfonate/bicarbonate transport system, substrate-binding protein [Beijerinckia sp. 28-YEA-48]
MLSRAIVVGISALISISSLSFALADNKPVAIRLGNTTTSGEDQIWLMKARPDLTPGQGKAYTLETFPFRGGDLRLRAFQAGQVDGLVSTGTGAVTAATKGVPLVIVAALSEEDNDHYSSPYVVLNNSPIKTAKDLKGKTIGLNGLREAFELGARMALLDAGLDPDRDVNWVVMPPATMGEALRGGKVAMVSMSQPFFAAEQARGDVRILFTAATAFGFKDEFLLSFNPDFVKRNKEAMRAFVADFIAATQYYSKNMLEARKAISQAKLIEMDPAVYLPMVALKRKEDGKPSRDYLIALQKALLRVGYIDKTIDIDTILDTSMFPQ